MSAIEPISLHEATRERYLSYALSVITSRALPDVRDGLKPVHRRILYTMYKELNLHPGGRYRKCAAVVGDVMGKYHPHGDQAIYDALVRMAQDFSLRNPLVDGQGNFGSLDGDPAAAMRYTECKLRPIAENLLDEIKKDTVEFRDTYDGQLQEPIVLPAQFPQLLVNGSEGIAVGLATRIPPHNLGEIIGACVALIDGEAHSIADLMKHVKGPDFPTGGRILNDQPSLLKLYEEGHGSVRIRGEWRLEKEGRRNQIIIHSMPYAVNKAKLIEAIGGHVQSKSLPQVVDVRDESTDIVRVVLELKQGASADAVMAYVYKKTNLETTFPVRMNALVPGRNPDVAVPELLDLHTALTYWLEFRLETVRRRYEFDLRKLLERIHILEGFAILFADLDEAIKVIRASQDKKDAAVRLMARFPLDELQTTAILDLQLYKLARMEIAEILEELEDKRAQAEEIQRILASELLLWARVRAELIEVGLHYADPRRTAVGEPVEELTFDETAYIVKEETFVVVTRGGRLKRQNSFTDIDRIRVPDNDEVGWLVRTDTGSTVTFFTSSGGAYTLRADDIDATTGHGKPLQKYFATDDGAHVVGVVNHNPGRWAGLPAAETPDPEDPAPPFMVSMTRDGRVQRFALKTFEDVSNRTGRRFAKLGAGDDVLAAYVAGGGEGVCVASEEGHVLVFPVTDIPLIRAAGKGTTGIKLSKTDRVVAMELAATRGDGPTVLTTNGREVVINERKFQLASRGGKGRLFIRRGGFDQWERKPVVFLGDVLGGK